MAPMAPMEPLADQVGADDMAIVLTSAPTIGLGNDEADGRGDGGCGIARETHEDDPMRVGIVYEAPSVAAAPAMADYGAEQSLQDKWQAAAPAIADYGAEQSLQDKWQARPQLFSFQV